MNRPALRYRLHYLWPPNRRALHKRLHAAVWHGVLTQTQAVESWRRETWIVTNERVRALLLCTDAYDFLLFQRATLFGPTFSQRGSHD